MIGDSEILADQPEGRWASMAGERNLELPNMIALLKVSAVMWRANCDRSGHRDCSD